MQYTTRLGHRLLVDSDSDGSIHVITSSTGEYRLVRAVGNAGISERSKKALSMRQQFAGATFKKKTMTFCSKLPTAEISRRSCPPSCPFALLLQRRLEQEDTTFEWRGLTYLPSYNSGAAFRRNTRYFKDQCCATTRHMLFDEAENASYTSRKSLWTAHNV